MNYSLTDITRICGGEFSGSDSRVGSVMTDSRHSFSGHEQPLFVAMKGLNHDGHRYIEELYGRGVRAFMVEKPVDVRKYPDAGFVRTESSIGALQALAADYRLGFKGVMVGITGSFGKTTVKELITHTAPEKVTVFRSPRSYNSQLGVPLSILMMRGDEDIALIEAGISRPGEMERLAQIIRPDIGIFTGLGAEHSENFISDNQKAAEKIKLFSTCKKIIYDGSPLLKELLSETVPSAELVDMNKYSSFVPSTVGIAPQNRMMAAAFYDAAGMNMESTLKFEASYSVFNRLDVREGLAGSIIVSDSDNTDINSLGMALDYLDSVSAGREKVVILSDIRSGGLPAADLYAKVAGIVEAAKIDLFVGVGETLSEYESCFYGLQGTDVEMFRSVSEVLLWLDQERIAGKAVLVKGNDWDNFRLLTHSIERRTHTTVLEVNINAIIGNLNHFRSKLSEGTKVMAMLKASGYGNGESELANILLRQGVDYLAVAFADEGVRMRERGIMMPIVVLNADSDSFGLMINNRLEPEIYNINSLLSFVEEVKRCGNENYPVHIKIDSGMHRLGFEERDIPQLLELLQRERASVQVRSVFSHLAAADEPREDDFTKGQIALFDRISEKVINSLGYRPLRHICNSSGVERFPEAEYDMVRLGIGLYGINCANGEALAPVGRLITRIVQTRELSPGETVGYGRAGAIVRPTKVAVIPVGYADGLDRRLGEGRWAVEIAGRPCQTVGRISMDNCVVDITGVEAAEGSPVMVFGGSGRFGVQEMAIRLGTIPYEIMTSVSERVRRIFVKD